MSVLLIQYHTSIIIRINQIILVFVSVKVVRLTVKTLSL